SPASTGFRQPISRRLGFQTDAIGSSRTSALRVSATLAMAIGGLRVFTDAPFTLHALDPKSYFGTVGLVAVMALAAMLVPARRVTRIARVDVLRYEITENG